jgi:hypothetical protein
MLKKLCELQTRVAADLHQVADHHSFQLQTHFILDKAFNWLKLVKKVVLTWSVAVLEEHLFLVPLRQEMKY